MQIFVLFIFSTLSITVFAQGWQQVGNDIDGSLSQEELGYAVSINSSGTVVAIGSPHSQTPVTGSVKVYELVNGNWTQKGNTLQGGSNEEFGWSVSLNSEGNTLAVGIPSSNNDRGSVMVFEFISNSWVQKGTTIDGDNTVIKGRFGHEVKLNGVGDNLII